MNLKAHSPAPHPVFMPQVSWKFPMNCKNSTNQMQIKMFNKLYDSCTIKDYIICKLSLLICRRLPPCF